MQLLIAGVITEIGKVYGMRFQMLGVVVNCKTFGMPAFVGFHELFFFGWREVADFENDIDMIGRDWRWIGRIGYLADEAAVLGESCGEALPRPRWSLVKARSPELFLYVATASLNSVSGSLSFMATIRFGKGRI